MILNVINIDPMAEAASNSREITVDGIRRFREERMISICRQSKQHGFSFRMWEGIIDPRGGWAGICLAYRRIVEYAMLQDLNMVCIAEDDIVFSAPSAWEYFLDQMPDDFDIYSGGIYSGQVEDGRIVNGWSGNTLIVVNQSFYKDFINLCDEALKNSRHLDRQLGMYAFKKNYRICEPYICFQIQGFSDNHRRPTKHKAFLEEMNLFTGNLP